VGCEINPDSEIMIFDAGWAITVEAFTILQRATP
jgi:hypothetical protein